MKSNDSVAGKKRGFIYILENPIYDQCGMVKMGYTANLEQRLKDLNAQTGVAKAFRPFAVYEVRRKLADHKLFDLIGGINPDLRVMENFNGKKRKREFFQMSKEAAYHMLECIAQISGTVNRLKKVKRNKEAEEEERAAVEAVDNVRQGAFKFSQCGIKPGETLKFVKDPSKVVEVVDDKHVRYDNYVTSLSRVAKDLLGTNYGVQGPRYFTYKGKLLTELRSKGK